MSAVQEEVKKAHIELINKNLELMAYDAVESISGVVQTVVDNGNKAVDNQAISIMPYLLQQDSMPQRLKDIIEQMKKDSLLR